MYVRNHPQQCPSVFQCIVMLKWCKTDRQISRQNSFKKWRFFFLFPICHFIKCNMEKNSLKKLLRCQNTWLCLSNHTAGALRMISFSGICLQKQLGYFLSIKKWVTLSLTMKKQCIIGQFLNISVSHTTYICILESNIVIYDKQILLILVWVWFFKYNLL